VVEDEDPEALGERFEAVRVVTVPMRDEDVRDRDPVALDAGRSGSATPFASMRTPWPPGSSATR
jgi:hypothetical protein